MMPKHVLILGMMVPGHYLQRVRIDDDGCIDFRNDGAWTLFAKGAYRFEE
jgi:hypothetical protein